LANQSDKADRSILGDANQYGKILNVSERKKDATNENKSKDVDIYVYGGSG
jgi:hypothetical protein